MLKKLSVILFGIFAAVAAQALTVGRMTVEMMETPLAVSTATPRFGWQLYGVKGEMQSAYDIEVAELSKGKFHKVWNSGKVKSGSSQLVKYAGPTLVPAKRYFWRVRVWNE